MLAKGLLESKVWEHLLKPLLEKGSEAPIRLTRSMDDAFLNATEQAKADAYKSILTTLTRLAKEGGLKVVQE